MAVTVDRKPLAAEEMGMTTVGQVLSHVAGDNRLVVHVLIDGQEPDLDRLTSIRASLIHGRTIYIETAEPKQMAIEVLSEVESQLDEADRMKNEAADLLQQNQNVKAMERLSGCFTTWQHAQESILKTGQLLRIDLSSIRVGSIALTEIVGQFKTLLQQIRTALENRDFVSLSDILMYETSETTEQWRQAIRTMRVTIGA